MLRLHSEHPDITTYPTVIAIYQHKHKIRKNSSFNVVFILGELKLRRRRRRGRCLAKKIIYILQAKFVIV